MSQDVDLRNSLIREWLADKPVGKPFVMADSLPGVREFSVRDLRSMLPYKRRLPHWESEGSTYFITFRVVRNVNEPFRNAVTNSRSGKLAMIIEESIFWGFGLRYLLDAYVVMPDHVHIILHPFRDVTLATILKGIKGFTAREINKVLNRKGSFWQDESMDHLIRNPEDWLEKFNYIHDNPVKAGLIDKPEDYPFSSLVTMYMKGRLESFPMPDDF